MQKIEKPEERVVDLLDFAPAFNALVLATGADALSLGINKDHLAIALRPANRKAVGPTRLREVLRKTGIYPHLFNQIAPKKGYVISSGSFGVHAATMIPTKNGPRWLKMVKEKTINPRPWNLLTVLYEFVQSSVDHRLNSLLPHFIHIPVYINGFQVDTGMSTVRDRDRQQVPACFTWQIEGASGLIYHNNLLPFGVIIQGHQHHILEGWPHFVILVENESIPESQVEILILEISNFLQNVLVGITFGPNQTIHKSMIEENAADKQLLNFLADNEIAPDLIKLLGFGVREQYRGFDPDSLDGFETTALRVIANPVVPANVSRSAVVLLPEEINIVDPSCIRTDYPGLPVEATSNRLFKPPECGPLMVHLVDEILVGSLALPYLYLEEDSQICMNGTTIKIANCPTLLLVRARKPLVEVFLDLAGNSLLLEGVLTNLYSRDVDIWEDFMNAVPHEQGYDNLDFDHELAAIAFLSYDAQDDNQEKMLLQLLSSWLHDTSVYVPHEARAEPQFHCHAKNCPHDDIHACIMNAREELMKFLLSPETWRLSPEVYAQYFSVPISWQTEAGAVIKEDEDALENLPDPV